MSIYIINIIPDNWTICDQGKIFGIPEDEKLCYRLRKGDLALVRRAHTIPAGCVSIWEFERDEEVPPHKRLGPNEIIPWTDKPYKLKQYFRELARFRNPLDEGFEGRSRISSKLEGWQIQSLRGSFLAIRGKKCRQYVGLLLKDKTAEICPELAERLQIPTPQIREGHSDRASTG